MRYEWRWWARRDELPLPLSLPSLTQSRWSFRVNTPYFLVAFSIIRTQCFGFTYVLVVRILNLHTLLGSQAWLGCTHMWLAHSPWLVRMIDRTHTCLARIPWFPKTTCECAYLFCAQYLVCKHYLGWWREQRPGNRERRQKQGPNVCLPSSLVLLCFLWKLVRLSASLWEIYGAESCVGNMRQGNGAHT